MPKDTDNISYITSSSARFIKVLLLVFIAELLTVPLMLFITGSKLQHYLAYHVVEILTIPLASALFLWWAVIRPLHRASILDMTERNEALKKLENTVSILEATLESAGDGIVVIGKDLRISAYNQKYLDLWPIPRDVIETRDAYEVFDRISPLLVDPDWFKNRFLELYENDMPAVLDIIRLKDGRIFERQSLPQKIDGETVGRVSSYRDVTERACSLQALMDSETRFRQIFEQMDSAQFIFDSELRETLDLNPAAGELFRCGRDQLVQKPPAYFFSPGDYERILRQQGEQNNANAFQVDCMKLSIGDGSETYISVHGRGIELGGRTVILCTFVDVTEKILVDRQARDIEAKLIQANKINSLGVLVAGIAHEINNPNNYIMVSSELLSNAWKDMRVVLEDYYERNGEFPIGGIPYSSMKDDIQDLFNSIIEGANRIRDIIDTLKEFARSGKDGMRSNIDLNQIVTRVTTIISHQIARHTRHFCFEAAPALPPVMGNMQQLEQVIINLLMNAIQALPSLDRGLRVSTYFDSQSDKVCVDVADEGDGISAEIAEKVMEPFFTTKLDSGGTGLGLSISQAIIRAHKGSLTFIPSPGQGTTFHLELPATSVIDRGDTL